MDATWWLQLDDLDEAQKSIIALETDIDSLVIGPPGSGKTNLLLLRASYLQKSGKRNFCILTLNRWLTEFLSVGAKNYEIPDGKIMTYIKWGRDILAENGVEFSQNGSFEDVRNDMCEKLLNLSNTCDDSSKFDYLLIDEVQDYTHQEIELLRRFTRYLYAVGDSKQRIYVADDTIEKIKGSFDSFKTLKYHYRNGRKICRLADGIYNQVDRPKGMEATSHYNELKLPSTVKLFSEISLDAQIKKALETLGDQLVVYPSENIGLIVPKKSDLQTIVNHLKQTEYANICVFQENDEQPIFSKDKRIIVGTVHSTKGMEFRACHLFLAETVKRFATQKKIAFTACTRAKTSLNVYHADNLPGYFENGFSQLAPIHEKPSLDSLFPNSRG